MGPIPQNRKDRRKSSRTIVVSMPKYVAKPPQTPAISLSFDLAGNAIFSPQVDCAVVFRVMGANSALQRNSFFLSFHNER
jgi:hypothetical protein